MNTEYLTSKQNYLADPAMLYTGGALYPEPAKLVAYDYESNVFYHLSMYNFVCIFNVLVLYLS